MVSCLPLYLIALGLPFISVSSVLNGYFSAIQKAYKSAFAQIFELFVKIAITIFLLHFCPMEKIESICNCLILADVISEICSCFLLFVFYKIQTFSYSIKNTPKVSLNRKILKIIFSVSFSSYLRSGLSTLKQVLIPNRLVLFGFSYGLALTEYGKINGMTMAVLLFPNLFITSFSHLLIPEFSALMAKHYQKRMLEICQKIFSIATFFSLAISILFFVFANEISLMVFHHLECANYIKILSPIILFMYVDIIFDSILKGLNKQFDVMFCNILDLILTILILYFGLPYLGLTAYLLAIVVSEISNFCMSLFCLHRTIGFNPPLFWNVILIFFSFLALYEVFSTWLFI